MLHHCQDVMTDYPDYNRGTVPRLLFVCQTSGAASAIPRVMHRHDDRLEIMFIARGSGQYFIGGQQYLAHAGDILIFNQGVAHDERPHLSEDSLIYSCGIKDLQIEGLTANHLISRDNVPVIASGDQYVQLHGLFDALCSQVFSKAPHYGAVANHLCNAIVIMCRNIFLARQEEMDKMASSLGLSIRAFIDEHYREAISLDRLSRELGITRFYLIHVFKRYSGYSPKQYLSRCRIGEAQSLLLNTDMDVMSVATAVGYESVNNFHRIFKMVVGIPPTKYKNCWMDGDRKAG